MRQTIQQKLIRSFFEESARPLSVKEILFKAQKAGHQGLGIATVYRALAKMRKDGVLKSLDSIGLMGYYELVSKTHHHHFKCSLCQVLFPLQGCVDNIASLLPQGFSLNSHEILLIGHCHSCSRQ